MPGQIAMQQFRARIGKDPMKSEAEIRKHMLALETVVQMPCDCPAKGCQAECNAGRVAMEATIRTLHWALGDSDEMSDLVERIDAAAKEARTDQRAYPWPRNAAARAEGRS